MFQNLMINPALAPAQLSELQDLLSELILFENASKGNIQMFIPDEGVLRIIVQKGFNRDFLDHFETVKPFDSTACGRAVATGSPIYINDVNEDIGFTAHRKIARSAGFKSVKSVPVSNRHNRFIGVISTHYKQVKTDWSKNNITITKRISEILRQCCDF